jgi:hypothetical protein
MQKDENMVFVNMWRFNVLLEVVSSYCNLLVVAKGLMVFVSGCGIWSCYFIILSEDYWNLC